VREVLDGSHASLTCKPHVYRTRLCTTCRSHFQALSGLQLGMKKAQVRVCAGEVYDSGLDCFAGNTLTHA
jgi:transposase-like protein